MYVKLFSKMLYSSVWLEDDQTLRVFLTLLLKSDETGFAQFSTVENLAALARVDPIKTGQAVTILESPDSGDGSGENEGRRIERTQGGWLILNYEYYRGLATAEKERERNREKQRRFREKQRLLRQQSNGHGDARNGDSNPSNRYDTATVTPSEAEAEAEAEAEGES